MDLSESADHCAVDLSAFPSPCFILEEEKLRSNLEKLRRLAQAHDLRILVALKAFAGWRMFALFSEYLHGASVSSLHEARLAYEEMGSRADVYMPAYVSSQFAEILGYVGRMSFNSLNEWNRYGQRAQEAGISCGLRLRPSYGSSPVDLYDSTSKGSRFGLSAEAFPSTLPQGIEGIHIHALCEADSYALERLLTSVEEQFGHLFSKLRWLNLGGGHLLTDTGYDVAHFSSLMSRFRQRYPSIELTFEPGSAVVWQAGLLKATVLDLVEQDHIRTAILDVSFTCHMPDCLEMPYRPSVRGARLDDSLPHRYRLGGLSCLAGDFLEEYSFEEPLVVGDVVVFEDMMHYTMVKTTQFNGISHPSLGLWQQGKARWIKPFSYDLYRSHLS